MNEKLDGPGLPRNRPQEPVGRLKKIGTCALALTALGIFHRQTRLLPSSLGLSTRSDGDWKWDDLPPSRSLRWHRCYNGEFDCARLDVPMDWLDPSDDGGRVTLAISRLRATDTNDYRGPVFFNPGGPGGSGIWALRDHGDLLQTIVGKNHDIITFDPRGAPVGASVPRLECWDSAQGRRFWDLQEVGIVDSHPGVIFDVFARAQAFSQTCERALNSSGILPHISTASHARDMLEILNQLGNKKLKYWGFSYGTILGGTFAALYPDRVEKLVSDGNVDYREWFLGEHINFLRDADMIMDAFYELCHQAGPRQCAFHASSPNEIRDRMITLLNSLRVNPVIIPAAEDGPEIPELVTYSKVKRLISSALYQPQYKFPQFAQVLAALEERNGLPYHAFVHSDGLPPSSFCTLEPVPPNVPLDGQHEATSDAFPAIMCADGEQLTETVEEFEGYAARLQEISSSTGAVNVLFRVSCAGRQVRPKWRFTGPFRADTSFPILFIANRADNVTPLVSARANSQGFNGSVVLIQNSYGHTSLSAPSTCTARHIQSYFQDSLLPLPEAECEPDILPFGLPSLQAREFDAELTPAVWELSRRAKWISQKRTF